MVEKIDKNRNGMNLEILDSKATNDVCKLLFILTQNW